MTESQHGHAAETPSSYLNAYFSGKARGFKKALSSNMSWSLILLTLSGLTEATWWVKGLSRDNNTSVHIACAPTFRLPGQNCKSCGPNEQLHYEIWSQLVLEVLKKDIDYCSLSVKVLFIKCIQEKDPWVKNISYPWRFSWLEVGSDTGSPPCWGSPPDFQHSRWRLLAAANCQLIVPGHFLLSWRRLGDWQILQK